ncbi:MAG: TetR/AcrR family transcriptional regulator [Pseudomonadota bacterium]
MRRSALVNADVRGRLLAAGDRLFTQRPYGAVSVEEIARVADVSGYQLYKIFKNKCQFVLAVAQRAAEHVDALQQEATVQATREGAIRVLLTAQVDSAYMRRSAFVEDFRAVAGFDKELRQIWDRCKARSIEVLCACLGIESQPPELTALLSAWLAFFDELLVATRGVPYILPKQIMDTSVASLHTMLHNYSFLDPDSKLSSALPLYAGSSERRERRQPLTGRRMKTPSDAAEA